MTACFLLRGHVRSFPRLLTAFRAAHVSVDHLYPLNSQADVGSHIPRHLLVSASHNPALSNPGYSVRKAKVLRKVAKATRRLELSIDFLDGDLGSVIGDVLSEDLLQPSSGTDASGDVVLAELTERRFPSEIVVVRTPEGRVTVRKTFCAGFGRNLERELKARSLVDDHRLSPILAASGVSLYLPWYRDYRSFTGGFFRFYPITAAKNVIDFLEVLSAKGLAMIDINPGSFLYDTAGNLKVVDCEYLTTTVSEPDFARSLDFRGMGPERGFDGPRATGWNHFWRDAVGAPYHVVRYGSPLTLVSWRAAQIVVRLLKMPITLLARGRQAVLSSLYYWPRRHPWGIRIHGKYSKAELLSSRTTTILRHLPESSEPTQTKY